MNLLSDLIRKVLDDPVEKLARAWLPGFFAESIKANPQKGMTHSEKDERRHTPPDLHSHKLVPGDNQDAFSTSDIIDEMQKITDDSSGIFPHYGYAFKPYHIDD